jgi:hypothetical protein
MAFSSADPRNYIALARQANADTEATTGFKFLKYLGGSGVNIEDDNESIYEGGDGQDQGLHYRSRVRPDGSIELYARPDAFTFLSAWALGSAAALGTSDAVGTSIFVPNATIPALTYEQAFAGGNQIERVNAAYLTGWQVEGEAGAPWRMTLPVVGGGTPYFRDGAASALSPVLESGDPAMYAGGAYLIVPSSNGTLATSLDVRRFSVNFARNVDDDLFTNQPFRRKVVALSRSLEVTFQVIFQDASLYKMVRWGGGSVIAANLATGAFRARRELAASQAMQIDVPNLRYTGLEINRLDPDGQTVVMDVSAMGVRAGTGILQVTSVHNNVGASAYLTA